MNSGWRVKAFEDAVELAYQIRMVERKQRGHPKAGAEHQAGRGSMKFKVGQLVRLNQDYVSSFGWNIADGTIGEICQRGSSGIEASFQISLQQAPLKLWVPEDWLRPLTKRERGPERP